MPAITIIVTTRIIANHNTIITIRDPGHNVMGDRVICRREATLEATLVADLGEVCTIRDPVARLGVLAWAVITEWHMVVDLGGLGDREDLVDHGREREK